MRHLTWIPALLAVALPAHAVTLINKDMAVVHRITVKCQSTQETTINPNETRDLGKGPCTVTVKNTGESFTASGNTYLEIRRGKIIQRLVSANPN